MIEDQPEENQSRRDREKGLNEKEKHYTITMHTFVSTHQFLDIGYGR
jgi:hypothetical protein